MRQPASSAAAPIPLAAGTLRNFNQERLGCWYKGVRFGKLARAAVGAARAAKPTDSAYILRNTPIATLEHLNLAGLTMSAFSRVFLATLLVAASMLVCMPSFAQSGEPKAGDKATPAQAAEAAKEAQRRIDEFADAARLISGPAGNPECVWLGRRVVGLLWRDDMDTAFRHLDLYDRFGCPGPHIQAAFRCVVRQGNIDPKSPQTLNARVHACWLNPASPPPATTVPPAAAGSPRKPTGAATK